MFFLEFTANGGSFEIERAVNIAVWGKKIVHNYKMNLSPIRHLDSMQSIELGKERIRVFLDVGVIVAQYLAEEDVFTMVNGLDDVLVIAGKVKETATLARRTKLGENIFARQGNEIVGGIETKYGSQLPKDLRGIVFKLEIILCGWCQLVASAIETSATYRMFL